MPTIELMLRNLSRSTRNSFAKSRVGFKTISRLVSMGVSRSRVGELVTDCREVEGTYVSPPVSDGLHRAY
jgi:hypothetical protein